MNWFCELYSDSWTRWSSACLIGLLGVVSVQYFRNRYNYWAARGVPGVRPLPLIGDLKLEHQSHEQQVRQFGTKVFGTFFEGEPALMIADAQVAYNICTRDSDIFPDHDQSEWLNKYQRNVIIRLRGDHWRTVRRLMTPSFTASKLRQIFPILVECNDEFFAQIHQRMQKEDQIELDLRTFMAPIAINGITTGCFSTKVRQSHSPGQPNPGNVWLARTVMIAIRPSQLRLRLLTFTPRWLLKLLAFEPYPEKSYEPLMELLRAQVEKRKNASSQSKFKDFLQVLVEADGREHVDLSEMEHEENHHVGAGAEFMRAELEKREERKGPADRKLSELEILGAAYFFLVAGFSTTLTTMINCAYSLAHHPDMQQRVFDEIDKTASWNESIKGFEFNYDQLSSCVYLDAVVSETLRLFTPLLRNGRMADHDYLIEGYNVQVRAGDHIRIAIHALHVDPEYWPDPLTFKPDRFLPGNRERIVPGSYMPFGMGPRFCTGLRFALMEIKLTVAKLLVSYHLGIAEGTKFPPPTEISAHWPDPKGTRVILTNRKRSEVSADAHAAS